MTTENKLNIASYFLKFLMGISLTIAFLLAFVYFHSMFSPEKYSNLIVNNERSLEYKFDIEKAPETYEEWQVSNKLFYYVKLDTYSKFSVIWTLIIAFAIYFFILFLFNKFLKNTKDFELFFQNNIKIINNIIRLLFVLFAFIFVVKGYKNPMSIVFENSEAPHFITSRKVTFDFITYYPLAIIFFFVLKQVFKRGLELKLENDLTI